MTREAILKEHPEVLPLPRQISLTTSDIATLHIPKTTLLGYRMQALLALAADGNKLIQVSFRPEKTESSETTFATLKERLTQKFGLPRKDERRVDRETVVWVIPSTIIRLNYTRSRLAGLGLPFSDTSRTELTFREDGSSNTGPYGERWAMSSAEVRAIAPAIESSETNGTELYLHTVGKYQDQPAKITFSFDSNRLIRSDYTFTADHADRSLFIDDYEMMKEKITAAYGQPTRSETKWRNPLFRSDVRSWGLAVSRGDVSFETQWLSDHSVVLLRLNGSDMKVQYELSFESRGLYIPGNMQ